MDGVKPNSLSALTTPTPAKLKSLVGAIAEAPIFTCQPPAIVEAEIPINEIKANFFKIL